MLSPSLIVALFAILSALLTVVMVVCVVLWRRLGGLTARPDLSPTVSVDLGPGLGTKPPGKVRSDLARRVDELSEKLRALEARLSAVEAGSGVVARPWGSSKARRVDRGASATSGGPTLIAVPSLSSSSSTSLVPEVAAELDRRFGAVWALADSGAPTETLARETGYPIGQVELILGLRRQVLAAEASHDA